MGTEAGTLFVVETEVVSERGDLTAFEGLTQHVNPRGDMWITGDHNYKHVKSRGRLLQTVKKVMQHLFPHFWENSRARAVFWCQRHWWEADIQHGEKNTSNINNLHRFLSSSLYGYFFFYYIFLVLSADVAASKGGGLPCSPCSFGAVIASAHTAFIGFIQKQGLTHQPPRGSARLTCCFSLLFTPFWYRWFNNTDHWMKGGQIPKKTPACLRVYLNEFTFI